MKILFPNDVPTPVSTKTERDQMRRTERTLRHAAMAGDKRLQDAATIIREFVDEQERQAEAELEELADAETATAA